MNETSSPTDKNARDPSQSSRCSRAALPGDGALPSSAAATQAQAHLRDLGYEAPDWAVICSGAAALPAPDRADDSWPFQGWQRSAARACDERTSVPGPVAAALAPAPPARTAQMQLPRGTRPLGDHRTACATSGVLSTRALPLEHAVARVCREAGARVARHVRLADMNLDGRRQRS